MIKINLIKRNIKLLRRRNFHFPLSSIKAPEKKITICQINNLGAYASKIKPEDIAQISLLTARSFLGSASYSMLPQKAKLAFIDVNTPERLAKLIGSKDIILACAVKHPETNLIMAYCIVKTGFHRLNHKKAAVIERLHVAHEFYGLGIGRHLVALAEITAKRKGHSLIVVKASGYSDSFYKKIGYSAVSNVPGNKGMANRGIDVPFNYLEKKIS